MTPFFIKHKYYMKKTYIEEAQEVYNNIVGCKIESYKFFVLQTLNGYGIKKHRTIKYTEKGFKRK